MSISFPYSAIFQGTVSAPQFVSNQVLIAPVAAGTASTLTFGSIAGTYSSITQSYASALTAGNLTVTTLTTTVALTTSGGGYSLIAGGASASNYTAVGASADIGGQMIMFMNGSARTGDGGTLTGTIRNDAGGDLRFITNSSGLYVKGLTGFVGLNNSSPAYTLDISGSARVGTLTNTSIGTNAGLIICHSLTSFPVSSAAPAFLDFNFTGTSQGNTTNVNVGPSPGGRLAINDSSYGVDLRWQSKIQGAVGNTLSERFTILGNGNIGVANSAPAYQLDVGGNARVTGNIIGNGSSKSYLYNAGIISNWAGTITDVGNGNVGMIFTSPATLDLVNGSNTSMVRVVGNTVGINTTSPSYTLDVAGAARFSGSNTFSTMQVTNPVSIYSSQGLAVGGTSSSSSPLLLCTSASGTPFIGFDMYQVTGASLGLDPSDSGKFKIITGGGTGNFTGTSRLTITSTGLVGINTTSPSYQLDITGTARVSGTSVLAQSAWIAVTFQNSFGNLGALPQTQCAYMKDSMGFVHLQGVIYSSSAQNTTAFTLPVGYRTSTYRNFTGATSGSAINYNINFTAGNGAVNVNIAAGQWVDLGVASFLSDA